MATFLTQKTMVLAKIESTYGTDSTPTTSADAIQVHDVELEIKREPETRQPMDVTLSPLQTIMGMGEAKVTIKLPLKGSGTAGTANDWMVLHKACGYVNTNSPGVSDTLKPDDTPTDSATIWVYKDGLIYKLVGCRGEVKHIFEAGKIVMLEYELQGRYAIPVDGAFPSAVTVDSTKPVPALSTVFTLGSYAAIIDKLELALNNEVVKNPDMNQAYGVSSFEITSRMPKGKCSFNAILRATSNADFWSYMDAGTTKALSIVIGTVAGNIATITAPVCVITSVKPVSKNGIDCFEVEFDMVRSSGGDELSIALT
jgi:hypothetical protein